MKKLSILAATSKFLNFPWPQLSAAFVCNFSMLLQNRKCNQPQFKNLQMSFWVCVLDSYVCCDVGCVEFSGIRMGLVLGWGIYNGQWLVCVSGWLPIGVKSIFSCGRCLLMWCVCDSDGLRFFVYFFSLF